MKKSKAYEAIERTARKYNVPIGEVITEIERGIDEAMKNPDPQIRENWKCMPWGKRRPSAEEFIEYISNMLKQRE